MQVHARKTKAMIVTDGKIVSGQSTPAHKPRMHGEGLTHMCPLYQESKQDGYSPDPRYIQYLRRDDNAQNDGEEEKEEEAVVAENDPEEARD
jgi:hypothetical protein